MGVVVLFHRSLMFSGSCCRYVAFIVQCAMLWGGTNLFCGHLFLQVDTSDISGTKLGGLLFRYNELEAIEIMGMMTWLFLSKWFIIVIVTFVKVITYCWNGFYYSIMMVCLALAHVTFLYFEGSHTTCKQTFLIWIFTLMHIGLCKLSSWMLSDPSICSIFLCLTPRAKNLFL